jgi:hypothetical protein
VDDFTFDAVARAVATGASRRQALRLLAAGALTAWLPRRTWAAPARQGTECEAGLTFCEGSGACSDLGSDPANCGACGTVCDSGVCDAGGCLVNVTAGCAEGLTDCTGNLTCVDLSSDPFNCGGCGTVCASGVCEAGFCVQVGCAAGLTYCEAEPGFFPAGCYDLSSDLWHCGSCSGRCTTAGVEKACIDGQCVFFGCPEGQVDCTGNLDCTYLSNDPNNCGACGVVCPSGVCEAGSCFTGCGAGLAYCPARQIGIGFDEQPYELAAGCYDLYSDRNHCGSCDITCPTTVGCYMGECTASPCEEGQSFCQFGGCVNLLSDPNRCGACDIVCAAGEVCNDGVCGPGTTCAAGLTYCPAKTDPVSQAAGCYDLSSDYTHCGSCDNSCPIASPGPMACIEGQCQKHCDPPRTLCENPESIHPDYCADLSSDPQNCGTCRTVCESEVCEAGTCTAATTQVSSDDSTPTTTRTITDDAPPTTTPAAEETTREQEARGSRRARETRPETQQGAPGAGGATDGTAETRATRSPRARDTGPEPDAANTAQSATEPVLAWPFDPKAGQWTIVHGYRAEDEDTNSIATPPVDDRDFARLALEFAVCAAEDVDVADGTCDLGAAGSDSSWDREATQGSAVVSPVDGTVAWTEGEASCLAVGIDIAGHSGYRLALFNVEGDLERGQRVTRGKRIGKVPRRGCERGDRIRMALYQPQKGTSDDPVAEREGVPFDGEWAIAGCEYPDDKRTVEQYREELVPCPSEDNA